MKKEIKWNNINKVVLVVQIVIFSFFGFYLARNIAESIGPDEVHHYNVSLAYSKTLGVPENTTDTYQFGDITSANILYYWTNGRILNLNFLHLNELLLLRLVNLFYSVGTLFILYLLSKDILKEKKYQVVPTVLLANTLMFQFLSAMVNYDNLVNLFAILSVYFFVKVFRESKITKNFFIWFIFCCLGLLTKFTMLPLIVIEFLLIVYVLIKNRGKIIFEKQHIPYILLALLVFIPTLLLYGGNILRYKAITPKCDQVMTFEQCMNNPVFKRNSEITENISIFSRAGLERSFKAKSPLEFFTGWIFDMTMKVYGILGHKLLLMPSLFYSVYVLILCVFVILLIRFWNKRQRLDTSLLLILLFYVLVLAFYQNYLTYFKNDVSYGFQGRYLFPVLPIYYILLVKYFGKIPNNYVRIFFFSLLILTFILGCIPFFQIQVEPDWFV